MSRLRRRTDGDLEDFDAIHDDIDVDFLGDPAGEDRGRQRHGRAVKHKAAWQRVDERREIRLLREQLEDWDDWGESWSDEAFEEAPGPH